MSAQRIVLRTHSRWLDDYQMISEAWIKSHKPKDSTPRYDIRVAFVDEARFHIVIDWFDNTSSEKVDISTVPLDIFRVRRGFDGTRMDFDHVDLKRQPHIYDFMREYGKSLPWALQDDEVPQS